MKNVIFFVILAVLTVAALVGWRAMKSQPSQSNQVAEESITPTQTPMPTPLTGTAIGRESGSNAFDTLSPTPQITQADDSTKGGSVASSSVTPTPVVTAAPQSNSFSQQNSGSTVMYTANGFNPKSLTVKSGTMVKFVNQTTGQMWIIAADVSGASKPEGMDMGVSVGNDGSYEYKFNSPGSWGYTNKNNPSHTGIIVVN